jgi:hypothetical protein
MRAIGMPIPWAPLARNHIVPITAHIGETIGTDFKELLNKTSNSDALRDPTYVCPEKLQKRHHTACIRTSSWCLCVHGHSGETVLGAFH